MEAARVDIQVIGQPEPETLRTLEIIAERHALAAYPRSIVISRDATCFLGRKGDVKYVAVIAHDAAVLERFDGLSTPLTFHGQEAIAKIGQCSEANARALRRYLPSLAPRPLGLQRSAGTGDRLGLATPGHIRAFRQSAMAPVLAQQSMRENARTGRTPQTVIDDAMWGAFQEGWRSGFGADADHLKTTDDIDQCVSAGYTMYTIDPSAHVDNAADTASVAELREKLTALPWEELDTTWDDTRARLGAPIDLGAFRLEVSGEEWLRAAAKYGRVVAHTVRMSRHLSAAMNGRPFDLEISIDESEVVTSSAEHVYIANELRRLGVAWTSLAPRYVGEFEKGVDYIGDVGEFERSFGRHLDVANAFGPYKLSLHSGSDKFRVFPAAARIAGELIHLKTSGTTYLEALRAVSTLDPDLFRDIAVFARERYPTDRVGYHVSADVARMPDPGSVPTEDLPALLDHLHARQILHVTFGSLVHHPPLRERLFATIRENEEVYYEVVRAHFVKHFAPFES